MAIITFSSDNLRKLLRVNSYPYSETNMMVFGIRGASIIDEDATSFKHEHWIKEAILNYENPRCIIGIWQPIENKIALFSASTVPNISFIKKQVLRKTKANCMMSGYYSFYEKGFHNPSEMGRHQALRLATNIFLRRSLDDFTFTNTDTVEVGNPQDNIHAAYCDSIRGNYSSAGCQVIMGQPKCKRRNQKPNSGHWKIFHDFIYANSQTNFDYALFRFVDAEAVANAGNNPMQARLRFGSRGNLVKNLQDKLKAKGYFGTNANAEFGRNTLLAVLEFQKDMFGANEADGVVGTVTAGALNLDLPMA
jgi:Putative peptidoglycan binding domain